MSIRTRADERDGPAPTHRLLAVVVPRLAAVGPDNGVYGALFDRAECVSGILTVLDGIVAHVLTPKFDGRLAFRVEAYESLESPERAGAAVLAASAGTGGGTRLMKEAAKLAFNAVKYLQTLSYSIADQPDLFYSAAVIDHDFPDWPEATLRSAVVVMSRAANRGDLSIEAFGGPLESLEFNCESAPSRAVGRIVIHAEVTSLDTKSGAVGYSGSAVDGDSVARSLVDKHRTFRSPLATDAQLRQLARCMADKQPCQFEVAVMQDALQLRFTLERWDPLASAGALELR
jgi:hypothetical protein